MFGLPAYRHFIQGSAIRTWNCVTHIANSIWYQIYPAKPTMPRSRRRYHSRSRSRSVSQDRDRDAKRRKIEGYDDSSESEAIETINHKTSDERKENRSSTSNFEEIEMDSSDISKENIKDNNDKTDERNFDVENIKSEDNHYLLMTEGKEGNIKPGETGVVKNEMISAKASGSQNESVILDVVEIDTSKSDIVKNIFTKTSVTAAKSLTPRQLKKKLGSEKKQLERQKDREDRERQKNVEKEEREKKKQQERDGRNQLKVKQKQEKEDQKNKERLEKQKEFEQQQKEKEQKRKEKEELEEQKRLKRQQEMDERNKEKQKVLEQKQKTSAMFVNFFTKKKSESNISTVLEDKKLEEQQNYFMPFELKSDMRLAPAHRRELSIDERNTFEDEFSHQDEEQVKRYLKNLKSGKPTGRQGKTWPYDDDGIMIVDDIGETRAESHKSKMRVKFLKFEENERPAYYGTWRKCSRVINPRAPYRMDPKQLNYEVDSDDEWEAEEGESLKGSEDEEEKEQEPDQDYEVDNEFFVPHCYLSDDEVDDEVNAKLNPEMHKAKLKLLKNEFDAEMKSQTQRLKTTIYGCVWINKENRNAEKDPMRRHMNLFACISNEFPIIIPKQTDVSPNKTKSIKNKTYLLDKELLVEFLKCIHGNVRKRKVICREFLTYLTEIDAAGCKPSLASLGRQMVEMAQWSKCQEEGHMMNKFCWNVKEEIREKYGVNSALQNKMKSVGKSKDR